MSDISFTEYWEKIKADAEASGYPIPDEDMATLKHMSGVSVEDFMKEYKAAVDTERGE